MRQRELNFAETQSTTTGPPVGLQLSSSLTSQFTEQPVSSDSGSAESGLQSDRFGKIQTQPSLPAMDKFGLPSAKVSA